jgi:two-component system cell cycle response regulator
VRSGAGGDRVSAPILIVDDNASNTKLMSFLLDRRGYDVRTAANATEALGTLTEFFPRLILMDLQMPGVDGFELTRRLKSDERYRDVVIIAVTAYAMKGDEARALEAGCDGYITKPVDTRAFPALVEKWLAS